MGRAVDRPRQRYVGRDLRPRLYALLGRANPAPPRILNERIVALHAAVLGNLASVGAAQGVPVIAVTLRAGPISAVKAVTL